MKRVIDEKYPMITFENRIDKFIVEGPTGECWYFNDYEGAEDFYRLNHAVL